MNANTPTPLGLSLVDTENQRTHWILGFKIASCAEAIKRIKEHEFPCLKVMVGIPFTSRPQATHA